VSAEKLGSQGEKLIGSLEAGQRGFHDAEVSGLTLTALADFADVKISDDPIFRPLDALGVTVRVRQR